MAIQGSIVRLYTLLLLLLLLFGAGPTASAGATRQGDECLIAADEVIEDDLFILCRTLTVEGQVRGNLLGAATRAVIQGQVTGDVYLLAGQLDVSGQVGDDLLFGGAVLRLLPGISFTQPDASLMYLSLSTTQEVGARLPGSLIGAGYQTRLDGLTLGNVNYWGSALQIDGTVRGDVEATVGDGNSPGLAQVQAIRIPFEWNLELLPPGLNIPESGRIEGDLRYTGISPGQIAGQVNGSSEYVQTVLQPDLTAIIAPQQQPGLGAYLTQAVREFITLLVIGLLALFIVPRSYLSPARQLEQHSLRSAGVGALTLIAWLPGLLLAVLAALVIGFGLAFLRLETLLALWGGGAGLVIAVAAILFYFMTFFVSRALACLWIGRWVVRVTIGDDNSRRVAIIGQGVGCALLALLSPVPVLGWVLQALAIVFGLGALALAFRQWWQQRRGFLPRRPLRPLDMETLMHLARTNPRRIPPPPLVDLPARPPGLDNLPPGFTWWED
jgi:cytoskeletal protein CcmA (bactofilin family)